MPSSIGRRSLSGVASSLSRIRRHSKPCTASRDAPVDGFRAYVKDVGQREHDELNQAAFAPGVFGVPTYLVADETWLGREHLSMLRWIMGGRSGPIPIEGEASRASQAIG